MKYIGLDLGSVTCGVAASDTGFICHSVDTIRFRPDDYDTCLDKLLILLDKEKPDLIVLGLPLKNNDRIGERAEICLEFGRVLEIESGIPVKMWDERFTTKESEEILLEADVSRKKRKKVIDRMAAMTILQSYLDSSENRKGV